MHSRSMIAASAPSRFIAVSGDSESMSSVSHCRSPPSGQPPTAAAPGQPSSTNTSRGSGESSPVASGIDRPNCPLEDDGVRPAAEQAQGEDRERSAKH